MKISLKYCEIFLKIAWSSPKNTVKFCINTQCASLSNTEWRSSPVGYSLCVISITQRDDPSTDFGLYYERRDILAYEQGILKLGNRIVMPSSLRHFVLRKLHFTDPGINAVKSLARTTVWWLKCDSDMETFIKSCDHSQKYGTHETHTPLNLWNTPEKSWDCIHIDLFLDKIDNLITVAVMYVNICC